MNTGRRRPFTTYLISYNGYHMASYYSSQSSTPLHRSDRRPHSLYSSALRGRIRDIPPVTGSLTDDLGCLDIRTGIAYIRQGSISRIST